MNVFDVDYWIGVMCRCSWTLRTLDEKSQHALTHLFHLTDQIAPVGRDNRREFWITAERGSIEDATDTGTGLYRYVTRIAEKGSSLAYF